MSDIFESKHIRCVPVIAVFSSTGNIKPLYMTINYTKIKIEDYVIQDAIFGDTWICYLCNVIDNDRKRQIKLQYNIHEHAWFIDSKYFQFFNTL